MNNEVKGLQFLVNQENCSLIRKVNIRILRESMKISCIWDRKSPRGKRLAPPVKIPYRRPCWNPSIKRMALTKQKFRKHQCFLHFYAYSTATPDHHYLTSMFTINPSVLLRIRAPFALIPASTPPMTPVSCVRQWRVLEPTSRQSLTLCVEGATANARRSPRPTSPDMDG